MCFLTDYDLHFAHLSKDSNNHLFLLDLLFENVLVDEDKENYSCLFNNLNNDLKLDFFNKISDELFIQFLKNLNMVKNGDEYIQFGYVKQYYCGQSFLFLNKNEVNLFLNRSLFILMNKDDLSLHQKEILWLAFLIFYSNMCNFGEVDSEKKVSSFFIDFNMKRKLFACLKENIGLIKNVYNKYQNVPVVFTKQKKHHNYLIEFNLHSIITNFCLTFFRQEINRILLKKNGFKKLYRMYISFYQYCYDNDLKSCFSDYKRNIYNFKNHFFHDDLLYPLIKDYANKKIIIKTKQEKDAFISLLLNHVDFSYHFVLKDDDKTILEIYPFLLDIIKENKILFEKLFSNFKQSLQSLLTMNRLIKKDGSFNKKVYINQMAIGIPNIEIMLILFHWFKENDEPYFHHHELEKYCLSKDEFKEFLNEKIEYFDSNDNRINDYLIRIEEIFKTYQFSHDEFLSILGNNSVAVWFFITTYYKFLKSLNEEEQIIHLNSEFHDSLNPTGYNDKITFRQFLYLYDNVKSHFSDKAVNEFTNKNRKLIEEYLFQETDVKCLRNLFSKGYYHAENRFHFLNDFKDFFIKNKVFFIEKVYCDLFFFMEDSNQFFEFLEKVDVLNESDFSLLKNKIFEKYNIYKDDERMTYFLNIEKKLFLEMISENDCELKNKFVDDAKDFYQFHMNKRFFQNELNVKSNPFEKIFSIIKKRVMENSIHF